MRKLKPAYNYIAIITCLIVTLTLGTGMSCSAQYVPDTTLNQPIPQAALERADSLKVITDTATIVVDLRKKPWEPVPKKAGLYAAIIPGFGQAYNRQYWKMPIVYAALGAGGYFFATNLMKYRDYRRIYIGRLQQQPIDVGQATAAYTDADIKTYQDTYRRYADISILLMGVGYGLQILDAVASAHLRNFDVSRDISMQMKPVLGNNFIGFGLAMNFK